MSKSVTPTAPDPHRTVARLLRAAAGQGRAQGSRLTTEAVDLVAVARLPQASHRAEGLMRHGAHALQ
jgi:hypothetical protein